MRRIAGSMADGLVLNLLNLPDDVLLIVSWSLSTSESVHTLPLVCKTFAQLLRLPDPRLDGWDFCKFLGKEAGTIQGTAFCKWLRPRLAQLVRFTCPVDALQIQSDTSFASELLAVLPNTLKELYLQDVLPDLWFWRKLRETQGLQLDLSSAQFFLAHQDLVPHLSALRRLSSLQKLSLPVHATLDKYDLESLAAIGDLQDLQVTFRDSGSQPGSPFVAPDASLSLLAPLTSLSMADGSICHLAGAAQLSGLMGLEVTGSDSLSLHDVQQSVALRQLSLANVHLSHSGPAMLETLHTLSTLESLALFQVTFPRSASLLRFATLLGLSTLKSLDIRRCGSLLIDQADDEGRINSMLTRFSFEFISTDAEEGLAAPGLKQLHHLQVLRLCSGKTMAPDVIPDKLGSLLFLRDLRIDIRGGAAPAAPAQTIDISALALLGPNIAEIAIRGRVQLLARSSLLQLAAQPRLDSFHVWDDDFGERPCISPEANSWLHCAALFHALLDRPHRGLSCVSLVPDLSCF